MSLAALLRQSIYALDAELSEMTYPDFLSRVTYQEHSRLLTRYLLASRLSRLDESAGLLR